MPVLELKNVWKVYGGGAAKVEALKEINLSIKKGQFVSIMGKSGSGKSTLLNSIGCLDVPTTGEIYLDGIDISSLSDSALAQIRGRKIGFIFQRFNLIPSLTALDNVMLPMMFQDSSREKREKRAKELLAEVGLGHRGHHFPNQMSGGEMQRVAIARALINEPEVLLADEPTGNLDSKTGEVIMQFLTTLHEKGKTIILVTHDTELSKKYAKVSYILADGKLNDGGKIRR